MEPFLDLLSTAHPVDAPPHLLMGIKQRIAAKRKKQRRWLQIAAAAAVLLWGVEGYVLAKSELGVFDNASQVATLVDQTQNSLY